VGEAAALRGLWNLCQAEDIAIQSLGSVDAVAREPALAHVAEVGGLKQVYYLPEECQIRNPRHLRALVKACQARGVELLPHVEPREFVVVGERLQGLRTTAGTLRAGQYALAAGAWTQQLLAKLGYRTGILPMRGQMLLFNCVQPLLKHILNVGNRYLVPREDGRVLVGSTEEEVGFDKRTTAEGLAELSTFASTLIPALAPEKLERTWAGLRPATFDGLPYIGRIPGLQNAFAAAGHFRSGLYLSPGTAVVVAELMRGQTSQIDLSPFCVGRG
jgi:glycine oxidase